MQNLSKQSIVNVSSLGAPGNAGTHVHLTTDGCLYYDNGTSWINISQAEGWLSQTKLTVQNGFVLMGDSITSPNWIVVI